MNRIKEYGKRIGEYIGDFTRVGGALSTLANSMHWYNEVKDYVFGETIKDLGRGLTDAIQYPLFVYGVGEAVNNVYKSYIRNLKEESFPPYVGRLIREKPLELLGDVMTIAPIATPVIAHATDGDFFKSVLIPAGICIAGHAIKSLGKTLRKK